MFSLHGRRESPGAKAASPARSGRIVVAGSVATLLMVCAPAGPAGAASAGASDGSGSVSVGVAGGASGGGSDPGSTGARPGGGSGPVLGSGGRPVAVCSLFALPAAQSAALGVGGPTPGAWYAVRCSVPQIDETTSHFEWIPAAAVTAGVPPVVDLSRLARRAEASIVLPKPTIGFDPSPFSVVNIVTWLWIDWNSTRGRPRRASGAAGSRSRPTRLVPPCASRPPRSPATSAGCPTRPRRREAPTPPAPRRSGSTPERGPPGPVRRAGPGVTEPLPDAAAPLPRRPGS